MNRQPRPRRRRRTWWCLAGALVLAPVLWRWMGTPAEAGGAIGPPEIGDRAPAAPAPAPGDVVAPGGPAQKQTQTQKNQRDQIAETVAAHNRESAQDEATFRQARWTMVDVPPPDPRLVALDPALLDGREDELRVQIASTVAPPELASRLHRIARGARQPATRVAAVEALGRIGTAEAQDELLALLPALPAEDDARRQIVPLLRPEGLDDPLALRLAALLDGPALTPVEKKQVAFTLAVVGLRDGKSLPAGAVSAAAQQLVQQMTVLAQRASGDRRQGETR